MFLIPLSIGCQVAVRCEDIVTCAEINEKTLKVIIENGEFFLTEQHLDDFQKDWEIEILDSFVPGRVVGPFKMVDGKRIIANLKYVCKLEENDGGTEIHFEGSPFTVVVVEPIKEVEIEMRW